MARFDLTDFERSVIQPLLPDKPRGVARVDDRLVLNGIFWRLRTGAPWADIRSAMALLGWSQQELADKAIVSLNAVTRFERSEVDPRVSALEAVEEATRKAGVEFISADERRGEGVQLSSPE